MHTITTLRFRALWHMVLAIVLLGPITSLLPGLCRSGDHNLAAAKLPIPISYKHCTSDRFDPEDGRLAMEGLLHKFKGEATDGDIKLRRRSTYYAIHGTAIFYICNCIRCEAQTFPESETREAWQIIANEDCGPGRGGYVWSMQWNKGWAVTSANSLGGPDIGSRALCPTRCNTPLWDGAPACEWWSSGTGTST